VLVLRRFRPGRASADRLDGEFYINLPGLLEGQ